MPQPAVIELGEAGWAPGIGERRARRPSSYRLVGAALAAAAVLSTGGAAGSGPGVLAPTRLPASLEESVETDGEFLFVTRPHRNRAAAERTITAYGLPEGDRRWQVTVAGTGDDGYAALIPVGDAVLIFRVDVDGDLTALDGRTGERRWRHPGRFMGTVAGPRGAGELVLIGTGPAAPPPDAPEPERAPETITAVDLRTGATAWSYLRPVDALVLGWQDRDTPAPNVVIGLPSGRIEVRDSATAEVVSAVDARPPVEALATGEIGQWLTVAGGLALVMNPDATLTAFALPDLRRRWTIPLAGGALGWYGSPTCGDLLCLQMADNRVHAVDPDTGQVRWWRPWSYLHEVGTVLIGGAEHPFAGPHRVSLIDPATGRSTTDLGVWEVAGPLGAALAVVRYEASARLARFGLIEPGTRDVRLAGVARGVVGDCLPGQGAMVCRALDASIAVYPLR